MGSKTYYGFDVQSMLETGEINKEVKKQEKFTAIQSGTNNLAANRYVTRKGFRSRFKESEMIALGVSPSLKMYSKGINSEKLVQWLEDNYPISGRTYSSAAGTTDLLDPDDVLNERLFNDENYDLETGELIVDGITYKRHSISYELSSPIESNNQDEIVEWTWISNSTDTNSVIPQTPHAESTLIETRNRVSSWKTYVISAVYREDRTDSIRRDLLDNYEWDEDDATLVLDGDTHTEVKILTTDDSNGKYEVSCKDDNGDVVIVLVDPVEIDYSFTDDKVAEYNEGNFDPMIPVITSIDSSSEFIGYSNKSNAIGLSDKILAYNADILGEWKNRQYYTFITYVLDNGKVGMMIVASSKTASMVDKIELNEYMTPIVQLKSDDDLLDEDDSKWKYLDNIGVGTDGVEGLRESLIDPQMDNAFMFVGINPTDTKDEDNESIARCLYNMFDLYDYSHGSSSIEPDNETNTWLVLRDRLAVTNSNVNINIDNIGISYSFTGEKSLVDSPISSDYEFEIEEVMREIKVGTTVDGATLPYGIRNGSMDSDSWVSSTGGSAIGYLVTVKTYELVIRKRDGNTHEEIRIKDLTQYWKITNAPTFISGLIKDTGKLRLMIPLRILNRLPFKVWSLVQEHSVGLAVQSSVTVTTKWYQSGLMKLVMIVIAVVLMVIPGTQALGIAMLTGTAIGTAIEAAMKILKITNPLVKAIATVIIAIVAWNPQNIAAAGLTVASQIVSVASAIDMNQLMNEAKKIQADREMYLLDLEAHDKVTEEFMDRLKAMTDDSELEEIVGVLVQSNESDGGVGLNPLLGIMSASEFKEIYCSGLGLMAIDSSMNNKSVSVATGKSVDDIMPTNHKNWIDQSIVNKIT